MNKSDSITDLAAALAKAQSKIEGAIKDKKNDHFRSSYADLGAVWDAIRGPLTENGLSIVQFPRTLDGAVEVETILLHSTGQFISDCFAIPVSKRDAHGYMSATTYARRGALMAVAGIAPVDDDGNMAAGKNGAHADPIHEAKHMAVTEDKHLLVNGETRSSYEVDKERNGGKTPYMIAKETDAWVSARKAEIGKQTSEEDLTAWWDDHAEKLERLQKSFPRKHMDLLATFNERCDQVRRPARSVMESA